MKVEMPPGTKPDPKSGLKPGPKPDILQLSGEAQHTLKSTSITGILEAEAAYMMDSAIRFIDATDNLVFCHGRSAISGSV